MTKSKQQVWHGNVRDAALSILLAVDQNQAYSNLLLHQTIEKYNIDVKDRGLLTEITYGTLQHKMTLDYYMQPFIKGKLDVWVRWLLRLSFYQLLYLSRVPAHAVVNEAVEIAKKRGHKGISATVNGILRSVQRQGVRQVEDIADPIERVSIETSHPDWLVKRWVLAYGFEKTAELLRENNIPPLQTLRVNTLRATVEDVLKRLDEEGISAKQSTVIPECIHLLNGQAARTKVFQEGFVTIQDESSMIPAYALEVKPGMRVLDMCAAPGGKTTHIAEKMHNEGQLISCDLHPHKIKLIEENANRLGLSVIQPAVLDGRKASEVLEKESFDRILVDAPCSGLGVIKRKPDIKYTKKLEDFSSLQQIQLNLLHSAYLLLKKNGRLVYSTCTIDAEENGGTVRAFLEQHQDMEQITMNDLPESLNSLQQHGTIQVFPQDFGSDGFFVAAFQKKGGSDDGSVNAK